MDEFESEWDLRKIALVLIMLTAFAFSIYYLLQQPEDIELTENETTIVNKCDPFPAEIGAYRCAGLDRESILQHNFIVVCTEYDSLGNCIDQKAIPPSDIYIVYFRTLGITSNKMRYMSARFEEIDYADNFFNEKLGYVEHLCSAESDENRKCDSVSFNGAEGFYLEENANSEYMRGLLLQDGTEVIVLEINCESQGDLLSLSELEQVVLEFREIGGYVDEKD